MCCWTPPGTSHEYGQAMPILTARPRLRLVRVASAEAVPLVTGRLRLRARRSGSRSLTKTFCSMCQSCGCSRIAVLEDGRHRLGHRGGLLLAGAVGRDRDLVVNVGAPLVLALEPAGDRHQRRPGLDRQGGRARREQRLLAEEVDLDPGVGQVPVGDQADQLARPQPLRHHAERVRAAGGRQHLHAEPLPEVEELLEDRLGLEPLGHGGERAGAVADDPPARLLEVAHVRQGEDHAAAVLHVLEGQVRLVEVDVHAGRDPVGRDHLHAERLQVVPRVRAHDLAGERAQLLAFVHVGAVGLDAGRVSRVRSENSQEVALEDPHPAALPAPGECRRRS